MTTTDDTKRAEQRARCTQIIEQLASERRRQDITQEALATRAGVSVSTLRNAERGATIPSLDVLLALADVLGATLELKLPPR